MKTTIETFIVVDALDLEQQVQKSFGQPFNFQADQELGNDSEKVFQIEARLENSFDNLRLTEFNEGRDPGAMTQSLLEELCRRGEIEPGRYLVRLSY